jgi:peptide/nickel transport system substrate-binding protein/oligopeptide transport system substrate-binding protein
MRRLTRIHAIVGVLLMMMLTGCSLPWPFAQPTPNPKLPDAQQILHLMGAVHDLDPALVYSSEDVQLAQLLFPQLVTLDEKQQPVDWAAESHEISADGLTYTFHLHKGMTWSDGTPINATTFAYSINRALDPCTGELTLYLLYNIKGAEAFNKGVCPLGALHSPTTLIGSSLLIPDPLTLQILLQAPAGYFLAALTEPASWAVPQALVEQYTKPATNPDNSYSPTVTSTWTNHLADNGGLGGNLFMLTALSVDAANQSHLIFSRNDRFWGHKPLLRHIDYVVSFDASASWGAFLQGSSDIGYPLASALDGARHLKDTTYHETPVLTINFLRPNWKRAPFDDVRVRQAFWLAIDRQAFVNSFKSPLVQPTIHFLIEGLPGFNPALQDPAGRSGAQALTADLKTARSLVAAYAAEKCQGRLETCAPVLYYFNGGASQIIQRANALVAQWQAAFPGWQISDTWCDHCTQLDTSWIEPLSNGSWGEDYPDGQDFLSALWRTGSEYSTYSPTGVSVPPADTLLDQADASSDQALRARLYQQAEQLLVNQVAAIPLFQSETVYVVRTKVVNWRVAPTGLTPLSVWQMTYISR